MSFLAGRLAGKEAAYFFEESKQAVTRLAEKSLSKTNANKAPISNPNNTNNNNINATGDSADVLPEILRHSLPAKVFRQESMADHSSNFSSPKWALGNSGDSQFTGVSPDVMNPLRGYLSLPQVTFGPKRWQLPSTDSSFLASKANDLRRDQQTHVNPEKIAAAAEGLAQIGKAFAVATAIIFSSAALTFGLAATKLDVHNSAEARDRAKDFVQPTLESIKDRLSPLRDWAENKSKKYRLNNDHDLRERPIIKELTKMLGAKSSS